MTANDAPSIEISLAGRTAIAFGVGYAGEGWTNGKAAAIAYAKAGAAIACIDIDPEAARRTAAAITEAGGTALALEADVTDLASIDRATQQVLEVWGRIDILHNNVGVTHMGGPVDLDEATYERSMALNLGSVYRTAKSVLPQMIAQGGGVVINISSLAGLGWIGYPYYAYSVAKAGVNHATVSIAMQYARQGIRANCVVPGLIDTPLIYKQIAGQYASAAEMVAARDRLVPLGKMGNPWDVARAALFLASDHARFITGVCLPVDGGQHAAMLPLENPPAG